MRDLVIVKSQNQLSTKNFRFVSVFLWLLLSVILAISIATVSSSLFVLLHEYLSIPLSDEWHMIAHWYVHWQNMDSSWSRLFDQHSEHRIALPRMIFFTDLGWFRGSWYFTLGCLFLIQLLHAMLLTKLICTALSCRAISRLMVGGIVVALMFSALQIRNLVWGLQVQFVGVFFLGTVALYFLLRSGTTSQTSRSVWNSPFLIGVFSCIAATFTMANGLLVWVVGMMFGIKNTWSLKRLLAFWTLASLVWLVYFADVQFDPALPRPWDTMHQLLPVLQYMAVYLGNPISPAWRECAILVGLLGMSSTLLLALSFVFDRTHRIFNSHALQTLLAIVVFVLLTTLITALGRIEFGAEQAMASRYATPALIFWIATCALLLSIRVKSRLILIGIRQIGAAIILSVIFSALTFQLKFSEIEQQFRLTRLAAAASLLSNVYDKSVLEEIHPHPPQIMSVVDALREDRLSLFSMEIADLIGRSLEQSLSITPRDQCAGHIDQVTGFASDRDGFRLRGWAIDKTIDKPADQIILVSKGLIRGVAFSGVERKDVEKHYPGIKRSGWFGYVRVTPGATVQAYALIHDNQSACLLNGRYRR